MRSRNRVLRLLLAHGHPAEQCCGCWFCSWQGELAHSPAFGMHLVSLLSLVPCPLVFSNPAGGKGSSAGLPVVFLNAQAQPTGCCCSSALKCMRISCLVPTPIPVSIDHLTFARLFPVPCQIPLVLQPCYDRSCRTCCFSQRPPLTSRQ